MASAPHALPELDEPTLLAGLRGGDAAAYEDFVRRYGTALLVVARRILGNEEDARDALQDAFLSAFKQIDRFDGRARLGTWLHRIVVNAALMRLRQRRRHPERSIDALLPHFTDDEHQIDPPARWPDSAEEQAQRGELLALVRQKIDHLPEDYRTVLLLRDIEELDTEDTARLLGTSRGVVKTRLHRARQALRTLLDPHVRKAQT